MLGWISFFVCIGLASSSVEIKVIWLPYVGKGRITELVGNLLKTHNQTFDAVPNIQYAVNLEYKQSSCSLATGTGRLIGNLLVKMKYSSWFSNMLA